MSNKKQQSVWAKLLKIVIIAALSVVSSRFATTNQDVDTVVKNVVVGVASGVIDVMSSDTTHEVVLDTVKGTAVNDPQ